MRNRYLTIVHFTEGQSRADIARYLIVARESNSWVQRYLDRGIEGLNEDVHTGRQTKLSALQLETISNFIHANSASFTGGLLQVKDVQYLF